MDTLTLSQNIGKQGTLKILQSGMKIQVKILNARQAWNRIDYLVTPVSGTGEDWVSASRVTVQS